MKPISWMYILGGILILASLCFMGWGGLNIAGSSGLGGDSEWMQRGIVFLIIGLVMSGCGVGLVIAGVRKVRAETVHNVTYKVDLPGETKFAELKCRSCGGTLSADNVKLVNGAPMVNCPYCNTVYQLTEEPKW